MTAPAGEAGKVRRGCTVAPGLCSMLGPAAWAWPCGQAWLCTRPLRTAEPHLDTARGAAGAGSFATLGRAILWLGLG